MEKKENQITLQGEAVIPTDFGDFRMIAYSKSSEDRMPHLVLCNPETKMDTAVNVRIHSECITGEVFGSNRCECGEQLQTAMSYISQHGGIIIYLRQEGRGIGIINKLHAYEKQDLGYDTVDANKVLGFVIDGRKYDAAVKILNDLKIKSINLITNNPDKIEAIEESNIAVLNRIPLEIQPKSENRQYLKTKKDRFGHHLDLV